MALSWKRNPTHKGGVVEAAKQWKTDQQQYMKIVELERISNSVTSIKYEDLVSNPEKVLKSVLKIIGLNFELEMLDMDQDSLTAKNAKTQKAWENLSKPVMSFNFNKFEKELGEKEIKYIESICYFEMKYFGYKPLFDWDKLNEIQASEIKDYHNKEINELIYEPVNGVKENMMAKQRFYQHLK